MLYAEQFNYSILLSEYQPHSQSNNKQYSNVPITMLYAEQCNFASLLHQ